MNALEISLFSHRLVAVCEEMGALLRRAAISPNIRDREDYSCALFDAEGEMIAQAAHIPVHLGSMAFAMRDVVDRFDWRAGDVVVFNDPFAGGTHLPDVTLVSPVFVDGELTGFAAARAHHAEIGGGAPGSMGLERRLEDEGLVLSPAHWFRAGREQAAWRARFAAGVHLPEERLGDLAAQRAAVRLGVRRLQEQDAASLKAAFAALREHGRIWGERAIRALPDGAWRFADAIEDDGLGNGPLPVQVELRIAGEAAWVDFGGTAAQTAGPLNCPLSVTAAAVWYAFRCLMPAHAPSCASVFAPIRIRAPEGSLVHARAGAAVAAGNVETSQRIVDAVLGALAQAAPEQVAAAAQGTMNNVIFAGDGWSYYETLGGGMGAHAGGDGLSAVQCHMTNTKNTSIEVLEMHYPLRIRRYEVRRGSGGAGRFRGGDGLIREWEVLADCEGALLAERRKTQPWALAGGEVAAGGRHWLVRDGEARPLPAKVRLGLRAGDRLIVETPGGGGFGAPEEEGA